MTTKQNRSILSKGILAVSLAAIVCGCSGSNWHSIYRNEALTNESNSGRGFFIDANQRVIFTSPVVHPSANMDSNVIVCAEPSPDVIKAISSQLATAAQATYQGAQGSAELQHQYAEAVTALGQRTASIQLLRDAYYRLCEARMDGFITNGTYPVALNRLDDAMVALLAIEHLTSPDASGPIPTITAPQLAAVRSLLQGGGNGNNSNTPNANSVSGNTPGANSGGANSGGANSGGANSGGANSGGANGGGANSGGANGGGANSPTATPTKENVPAVGSNKPTLAESNKGPGDRALRSGEKNEHLVFVSLTDHRAGSSKGSQAKGEDESFDVAQSTPAAPSASATAGVKHKKSKTDADAGKKKNSPAAPSPAVPAAAVPAAAVPAPAADAGAAPTPTATPTTTPTATATATPGGSCCSTEVGVGVNAATANAVRSITLVYEFKNLDETCMALAGTTLQAKLQVLEDPHLNQDAKTYILSQIEDEKNVHLWRYCNQIFDEFFLANSHILTDARLSADKNSLVVPPPALVPGTKTAP